jgi:hypothetical protein
MQQRLQFLAVFLCLSVILPHSILADEKPKKKKDITDYTDADLERLYEEWEVANIQVFHVSTYVNFRKMKNHYQMTSYQCGNERNKLHQSIWRRSKVADRRTF